MDEVAESDEAECVSSSNPAADKTKDVENRRLAFELFKHVTTLASGSLLLMTTVLSQRPIEFSWGVALAVFAFAVSIVTSLFAMMMTASDSRFLDPKERASREKTFKIQGMTAFISFIVGMIAAVIVLLISH